MLLFRRKFDYFLVRNWLFVGMFFFSIGMLMNEKKLRIGWWGIPVFTLTTMLERFLLVRNVINAARDQYISTIFLPISVLSFALEYKGSINNWLAQIGNRLSAWIYIIHPFFVTCLTFITSKIGIQKGGVSWSCFCICDICCICIYCRKDDKKVQLRYLKR